MKAAMKTSVWLGVMFAAAGVVAWQQQQDGTGPEGVEEGVPNRMELRWGMACDELCVLELWQAGLAQPMRRYDAGITYDHTKLFATGGDTVGAPFFGYRQELFPPTPNPPNAVYTGAQVPNGDTLQTETTLIAVFLFKPVEGATETGTVNFIPFPPAIVPSRFYDGKGQPVETALVGVGSVPIAACGG